jgi:hypothetical protein
MVAKANKIMFNSVLEEKRCKPKKVFVQFWCSVKVRKSQQQFFSKLDCPKSNWHFWTASLIGQLLFEIGTLQSLTGVYRENPVIKTGTLQWEQGFPVMKTGFSLWDLTHREFPVSYTGFGFAVHFVIWLFLNTKVQLLYSTCSNAC